MADRFTHDLHSAGRIAYWRRKNESLAGIGHVPEILDIADDEFQVAPRGVRCNDDCINRAGMIRGDDERSAGGDVLDAARIVRFDEARQEPTRSGGVTSLADDAVQVHGNGCGGAGGSAEDEFDESAGARRVFERKSFGQLEEHAFIK